MNRTPKRSGAHATRRFSIRRTGVMPVCVLLLVAAKPAIAGHGPADLDRDRDVDLLDAARFQRCHSGVGVSQASADCQVARIDDDFDVDIADYAFLPACWNGPGAAVENECTPQGIYYFPRESVWYQDVTFAHPDAQSQQVIDWLDNAGGWGAGAMRIDYSIEVLAADETAPFEEFIPTFDFFKPDCDFAPVPIPPGGAIEGEEGYACVGDGDCHLIVAHEPTQSLYEMWRAHIEDDTFYGGCLAVWDMTRVYPPQGRGENCTSADAAGYPIAPLLFTADEVEAGWIDHAIRFILPNSRIRNGVYLHPATHSTGATGGGPDAPPYGTRLRLRADYPLQSLPNEGARVVARAMQRYGILLSDGGTIALTAQSDRFTKSSWAGLLGTFDLTDLAVSDFDMVEGGERIAYTGDCVREP